MTINKWIWVTGCTGFTGSFLVDEIKSRHPEALVLGTGRKQACSAAVDEYICLDLLNSRELASQLKRYPPATIYHLAAAMPPSSDSEMWHQNVAMAYELLTAIASNDLHHVPVLSVGSAAELLPKPPGAYKEDDPSLGMTVYGKSKAAQARIAKALADELGLNVFFARAFNFLGPGLPEKWVAGRLCKQLATSQEKLVLGNLQAERDFIDIRDAVSAYCDIVEKGKSGEIYNVCTGQVTAISELVRYACELLGENRPEIVSDTVQLARSEVSSVFGDPSKLSGATGWVPRYSLQQSLGDMIEAYRNG